MVAVDLEVRATKAKNLLSSITALSFADSEDNSVSDATYEAETAHIQAILRNHQVFKLVNNGNALNKFYTTMIQQTKDSSALKQEVAMKFLAVAVEGSAIEHLEARVPRLLDVVFHALKHQHASVCVPALHILAHLMFNIDHAPVDTRRTIIEQVGRFVPVILHHLNDIPLSASSASFFVASFEALFVGCKAISATFRPFASKIEQACTVLLAPPSATPVNPEVVVAMANCLGAVPHATANDATSTTWLQMVERVVLTLHYQLDILSGKDKDSDSRSRPPSLKPWLKDAVMATLPLYLQAQRLTHKVHTLTAMLSALLRSGAIAEKDIVSVAADILALLRRAFSIRADTVGKQSAVSEDGRQLPTSVLYGVLPSLQSHFASVLSSLVVSGHVTIFRSTSAVAKVVQLICHNTLPAAVPQIHAALQQILPTFGAGAFTSIGSPVLDWTLTQLNHLVPQAPKAAPPAPLSVSNGKKKRQRQAEPPAQTISTPSIHDVFLKRVQTNAALETIAVLVSVSGPWIASSTRLEITAAIRGAQKDLTLDSTVVTKASLANAITPDSTGGRGLALPQTLQYFTKRSSGPWRTIAANVGESVLHPRAPPMMLSSTSTVEEKRSASTMNSAARAKHFEAEMDWDDEDGDDNEEEPSKKQKVDEEDQAEDENEEEDMEDAKAVIEVIEKSAQDDKEEPTQAASDHEDEAMEDEASAENEEEDAKDNAKVPEKAKEEEEDEFDFPDIVVE
ncbi:hypothetical protein LEN26_017027 [Aphanomyces euteiches]|nr:hypothetical protein LEN26_017027 [Aphanomyces euteiches]